MMISSTFFVSTILATLAVGRWDIYGTLFHGSENINISYHLAPMLDMPGVQGSVYFEVQCEGGETFSDGSYFMRRNPPKSRSFIVDFTRYVYPPNPGPPGGPRYWYEGISKICPGISPQKGDLVRVTFQGERSALVYFQGKKLILEREYR